MARVPENTTVGSEVITVIATDLDLGIHQSVSYSLLSNVTATNVPFEINNQSVSHTAIHS